MKNVSFSVCATLILMIGFQLQAGAQKTATWKGGTPGRSNDWSCATNWKEGSVPNEFSDVLIPQYVERSAQPVIGKQVDGVNSLTILPGASLRIERTGALEVFETLETFANNAIQNYGQLDMPLRENQRNQHEEAVYASNRK